MPCWPNRKKKIEKSSLTIVNEIENRKSIAASARGSISALRLLVEKNPIEAEKVLQEIFSYLPIKDLLQARQVCKRWNSAACYNLRRKIEGAIILQRGLSYYTRVMSKSLDIPIGRLFLKIDNMDDPAAIKFFQVVGPSILFLVLNLEGSNLAGFLTQVHHLKNLQQLSLNLFKEEFDTPNGDHYKKRKATSVKIFIEDYDDDSLSKTKYSLEHLNSFVLSCELDWKSNEGLLLEKLLAMSPNLKNLNLNKWPFMLKPNLFKRCEFENLKFFCLKAIDDQGLDILGKKELTNLKTVEFELSPDVLQESFCAFLDNVAPTLEYLEIKSLTNPSIYFKLPTLMKELNTIRLPTWVGPISLHSIISKAPLLEKLQLSNVSPSHIYTKDPLINSPNVNYLAINFGNGSHSIKTVFKAMKSFVIAFPNLKVLMMKKVSDKILEIICDGWPQLEALRITTSFALSDSGITGLPPSVLQKNPKTKDTLSCGCSVPFPIVNGKADCASLRLTSHIAQLQSLRDLRIEAEQGTTWTLTNLSLHLGLGELRQLNSLRLTCHELGPHWCLRCIADSLSYLKHLTIMDRAISHDRYDEQELHYLLRKLPNLNLTFAEADSFSLTKRGSTK